VTSRAALLALWEARAAAGFQIKHPMDVVDFRNRPCAMLVGGALIGDGDSEWRDTPREVRVRRVAWE
jgi:hypothetical protein